MGNPTNPDQPQYTKPQAYSLEDGVCKSRISSVPWDQIHFIASLDQLPTEINNTVDYPFTYEIQTLQEVFQHQILTLVECRYECSNYDEFKTRLDAYVIIDKN